MEQRSCTDWLNLLKEFRRWPERIAWYILARDSSEGIITLYVAKCLCSLGLMVKLPAVGFMQVTY